MGRKKSRKTKNTYAIVGEGITEQIYFDRLKYNENLSTLSIKPELPQNSDFKSIFKKADELLKRGVDKVYAIFDLDVIIGSPKKKSAFKQEIQKRNNNKLEYIFCNPCFEIWFYLHFDFNGRQYRTGDELIDDLKNHLTDYEKSSKYLEGKDIYKTLKPRLDSAIRNSSRTQPNISFSSRTAFCTVHDIISALGVK